MGLPHAGAAAAESAWEPVAPAGLPAGLAPEGGALPSRLLQKGLEILKDMLSPGLTLCVQIFFGT